MFAIDTRSLAAFRLGVAILILLDLGGRAGILEVFYSDSGVVPRYLVWEAVDVPDPHGYQYAWSLHLANGQAIMQGIFLGIAAWFAVWLLLGYRTRTAALVSWVLLHSLNQRNMLVCDAGDSLLSMMLFWCLFLPLGATWSIDRQRSSAPDAPSGKLYSVLTAAPLLQLTGMYLASAFCKSDPVWTSDWTAAYYALHDDTFVSSFGLVLREYPDLLRGLTVGTLILEFGGPVLAFSPWRNSLCRSLTILAFWLFHAGLGLSLTLGLFPWICGVAWLLFVPSEVWDRVEPAFSAAWQRLAQRSWWRLDGVSHLAPRASPWFRRAEVPHDSTPWGWHVLVASLVAYIAVWNVREFAGPERAERIMSHRWNGPAIALGLAQSWGMFAPTPRIEHGWLVMRGTLRDGTEVNLWEPGTPLPWKKPALVSSLFPNGRWRRYLENLAVEQYSYHRQFLADWLRQRWDQEHSGGNESRQVAKVEIFRQVEWTVLPGERQGEAESVELCVRLY